MIQRIHPMVNLPESAGVSALLNVELVLLVIQSMCLLATEGTPKTTATAVVARVGQEYGIKIAAQKTGEIISSLKITSHIAHGKHIYLLDPLRLEELRSEYSAKCQNKIKQLDLKLDIYKAVPQNVENLKRKWQEIIRFKSEENELTKLINDNKDIFSRLQALQATVQQLRKKLELGGALEKEIQDLTIKVSKLPDLSSRKTKLESDLAKYQQEEAALIGNEANLQNMIANLKSRLDWERLGSLQHAIDVSNAELEQISAQLNQKRTFLDKVLGRKVS